MRYHHRIDIDNVAHSSSGLGHHPLKVEITGSNPVCATIKGVEAQNRVHGNVAHSSSGLGHHPLKVEITGSNPVCATINIRLCRIRYAERGAFV